jgi:Adenylate and Guanylate cyclase catalytic domain
VERKLAFSCLETYVFGITCFVSIICECCAYNVAFLSKQTVNTAARMESNGEPNMIHVSHSTAALIEDAGNRCVTSCSIAFF